MALALLARCYNSFEAGLLRSRLAAEEIDAFLFDMEMGWDGMGIAIPIRVMVDEQELEAARRIVGDTGSGASEGTR